MNMKEIKNKIIGKMIIDGWNEQSANEMAEYLDLYTNATVDEIENRKNNISDNMEKYTDTEYRANFNSEISLLLSDIKIINPSPAIKREIDN